MALLLLCCVAVSLLPATAPEQQDVDSWLMLDAGAQATAPRRITPKSIFIAPSFSHALPACADGYRPDAMGRCVKVVRVDPAAQLDFLLRRLNSLYAPPRPATSQEDSAGPLQVSLPIGGDPRPEAQAGAAPVEVAVVLADVVKGGDTDHDAPQTMMAVWNISKNTTSEREAGSSGSNASLPLPRVEDTIPIVVQTPPSTLVIQDLPSADTVSRPLSSEVDFDIPYYDYYQDHDTTESRCPDPPCRNPFTEINPRSPQVPATPFPVPSGAPSDIVTTESSSSFSFTTDINDSDANRNVSSAEITMYGNTSDAIVEQRVSELFPMEPAVPPVVNHPESEVVGGIINTTVSLSRPSMSQAALPELYVGSFETSVEVSVKHTAEETYEPEDMFGNDTVFVSSQNSSDMQSFESVSEIIVNDSIPMSDETLSETNVTDGETETEGPCSEINVTTDSMPVTEILPEVNVTESVPEPVKDNVTASTEQENLPKKPKALPEESSLAGTSMDPLSEADAEGPEDSFHPAEQRPRVRFPSAAGDPGDGRVRFPDGGEASRAAFPEDFWWMPSGWKLDQSRHHPVLLRFWRRMPEAYLQRPQYHRARAEG